MRISDHTLNRLAVVKAILRHSPLARSELPRLTGLSAGLITKQVSDLVTRGLVSERKDARGATGRPRVLLEIAGNSGIVIGASIDGHNNLTAAFVSLAGEIRHSITLSFAPPKALADLPEILGRALARAIAQSPFETDEIARVGIGIPAILDSARGEVHHLMTFPPEVVPFTAPIAAMLGLPVTIENEMACMARAEHWFGAARDHPDFTMIRVGPTIWSAIFEDGVPHYGGNGLNPEFGHMKTGLGPDLRACLCGSLGCLTTMCSMYHILAADGKIGDLKFPAIAQLVVRFDEFVERASAGDAGPAEAVRLAGTHLGLAVANHLNVSSPSTVFIAVDHPCFLDLLQEPFQAALRANTLPGLLSATRIMFLHTTDDWRWRGTAALALEQAYLESGQRPRERSTQRRRSSSISRFQASS